MKKVEKDGKKYDIDCDHGMCGNCRYKPTAMTERKCQLFDIIFNHVRGGFDKDSGWKRHSKCIDAEIND
jgi:hypothetical protein